MSYDSSLLILLLSYETFLSNSSAYTLKFISSTLLYSTLLYSTLLNSILLISWFLLSFLPSFLPSYLSYFLPSFLSSSFIPFFLPLFLSQLNDSLPNTFSSKNFATYLQSVFHIDQSLQYGSTWSLFLRFAIALF